MLKRILLLFMSFMFLTGVSCSVSSSGKTNGREKPIFIYFRYHIDSALEGSTYPTVVKIATDLFEKYNIKPVFGFTPTIAEMLEEMYPETVEKIKMLKFPLYWHEMHMTDPEWRAKDEWIHATHYLEPIPEERIARLDTTRIGNILGFEKIFGVLPLAYEREGGFLENHFCTLTGNTISDATHINALLGFFHVPFKHETWEEEGEVYYVTPIMGTLEFPNMQSQLGPVYEGLKPGELAPAFPDLKEWLFRMAQILPSNKRYRIMLDMHNALARDGIKEQYEELIRFIVDRPQFFKVVWPDPEENQWKPEYSALTFFKEAYEVNSLEEVAKMRRPKSVDITVRISSDELLDVSDYLMSHWPQADHFRDYGGPPPFINISTQNLTLVQGFLGLAIALHEYNKTDKLPEYVTVKSLRGPIDFLQYPKGEENPDPEILRRQGMPAYSFMSGYWPSTTLLDPEDVFNAVNNVMSNLKNHIPGSIPIKAFEEAVRVRGENLKIETYLNTTEFLYVMAQEYALIKNGYGPGSVAAIAAKITADQPSGGRNKILVPGQTATLHPARMWIDPESIDAYWSFKPIKYFQ